MFPDRISCDALESYRVNNVKPDRLLMSAELPSLKEGLLLVLTDLTWKCCGGDGVQV